MSKRHELHSRGPRRAFISKVGRYRKVLERCETARLAYVEAQAEWKELLKSAEEMKAEFADYVDEQHEHLYVEIGPGQIAHLYFYSDNVPITIRFAEIVRPIPLEVQE